MPRRITSLVVVAAAALVLPSCGGLFRTGAATVDGEVIEEDRFAAQLDFLVADPSFAEQFPGEEAETQRRGFARDLLTFLIHQELVQRFAEERGITVSEEELDQRQAQVVQQLGGQEAFDQQVATADVTAEDVRDLVRQQILREKVAEVVVSERLTEERLRDIYEQRVGEFTEVHVAHILVSSRSEAERIAEEATPQNFDRLARQFSQDTGSAANGGDLGVQRPVDLVGPFADAMQTIPEGEIGGPVETDFGFHVIHVIERQRRSFEEVRGQLVEEARGEAFRAWLLERIEGAEIRVNPRYGLFDESTGVVIPRTATSPTPEPPVQVEP